MKNLKKYWNSRSITIKTAVVTIVIVIVIGVIL